MKYLAFLIRYHFPGHHYRLTEEIVSNEACEPECYYSLQIESVGSKKTNNFHILEHFVNDLILEKSERI